MSGNLITYLTNELQEPIPMATKNVNTWVGVSYLLAVIGAFIADAYLGRFKTILVSSIIYCFDSVGWAAGFGILTGAMVVALALFLFGYKKCRTQGPLGSPFTTVAQVFVAAARKRQLVGTSTGFVENFRCLDKAMIIDDLNASSTTGNPVVRSIGSNFYLPQASLQIFVFLTVIVVIPIYDRVFVPTARKITGHSSGITILQRIGIGLFLSIITMVVSGLVEAKRVSVVKDHNLLDNPKEVVPMRVWWLIPQYMVCGLSDLFALVGIQEFFYDQMPEEMRSMGVAAYLNVNGVGSFISSGIITVVQAISSRHGEKWLSDNINGAHLDYFYWNNLEGMTKPAQRITIWLKGEERGGESSVGGRTTKRKRESFDREDATELKLKSRVGRRNTIN
ncbi:protein NRT1/ PTR FAMILY 5.4-like [Pyrus ussuriensis x Pyrus communis]|uniref:Protein NRT1/ PTR FAMILY 5.4-like n=1 Tax=Pyrus ussuriensis x Pyrus communis TaxID=2448454 RepID=A0A5N5HHV0_9ROSA|nr:protein NRT1/ PTR FAMILY 5.4-like [Pyrus ussuriensis x Pyrus communis]